ncbi:MAG: choice-of-anchor D domain-containing protein [Bacteroidota bacterium]|nr:choice-of-anchor D domain-containing protein [Bacteroidota bacterium]
MLNQSRIFVYAIILVFLSFSVPASAQTDDKLNQNINADNVKTMAEPNISVSPESLSAELITGEMVTQTLTINNTGSSDLTFNIDIAGISTNARTLKVETSLISQRYSSTGLNVLLAIADDGASYITSQLLSYPDIASISIFSTRDSTPTIEVLQGYDVVMTRTFDQHLDPIGFGDVLADYVDQGGGVVLGTFSWYDSCGLSLCGRIMDPAYAPLVSASSLNHYSSANLQILNPTHPIMENVTNASDEYRDYTMLTTGSRLIARWSDGENFVAVKGNVVAVNSYVGEYYQFTGDVPLIVHNSLLYAAGRSGWLSANPLNGIVPALSSIYIDVTFNAGGLYDGYYHANLLIISNDPDEDTVAIPVHLTVTGVPDIFLSDTSFDFQNIFVGTSRREKFIVSNFGTDVLTISGIVSDNSDYSVDISNFSLEPGEKQNLYLTFTPTSAGERNGRLTISSNDPDEGESTISLRGEGILPPVGGVVPESLSIVLLKGDSTNRIFTITNSGESELIYNISIQDTGVSKTFLSYPLPAKLSGGVTKKHPILKNIKINEVNVRVYPEKIQNFGGPDPFGYRWRDSDGPDGLKFNWVDVSLGTSVNLKDDGYSSGIPLGFTFKYYGYEYTSVNIMSNGWLSFNGFGEWYPSDVPANDEYAGAIVPFGKDLFAPDAKYIRYQTYGTAPFRFFIVEYNTIPNYGGSDEKTFEVIFYESTNNIIFQYLNTQDQPEAIGIESPDQTMGMGNAGIGDLFISPTSIKNNFAIEFSIPPGWISVAPLSGVVLPDSELNVNVLFNPKEFSPGNYSANILIHSNDPNKRIITIPTKIRIVDSLDGPFTLTVNAINGLVLKNPDKPQYDKNESVQLTAVPIVGYQFVNWSGDTSGTTNPISIVMNSNKNITANFAINTYTLTVNATNGMVTKIPNQPTYTHGTSVQLTATPALGYHFVSWSGDTSGTTNPISIVMNSNKNITANFAINTYTLTVNATNGMVTKIPNQPTYTHGTSVQLTATPAVGYHFVSWSGDTSGTVNPISIVMNGNKNITAHFAVNIYKIVATAGENGFISPSDTVNVNYGDSVTFRMYPVYEYEVDSVLADGIFVGSDSIYVFRNVTTDHTIHVTFKQKVPVGVLLVDIPHVYSVQQNYPNPFNPITVIRDSIPEESKVTLIIFDLLGREVITLVDKIQEAGSKIAEFSARGGSALGGDASANGGLPSGMYFYRIEAISISDPSKFFIQVRKMILLR